MVQVLSTIAESPVYPATLLALDTAELITTDQRESPSAPARTSSPQASKQHCAADQTTLDEDAALSRFLSCFISKPGEMEGLIFA